MRQRQVWVTTFDEFHFPTPGVLDMMKHSSFGIATLLIKYVKRLSGCNWNPWQQLSHNFTYYLSCSKPNVCYARALLWPDSTQSSGQFSRQLLVMIPNSCHIHLFLFTKTKSAFPHFHSMAFGHADPPACTTLPQNALPSEPATIPPPLRSPLWLFLGKGRYYSVCSDPAPHAFRLCSSVFSVEKLIALT